MKKRYTFFTDPGHGWLAVPFADLVELKIAEKISSYSYPIRYRGVLLIYLEEDDDAGIFIEAARTAGWELIITDKFLTHFDRNRVGYDYTETKDSEDERTFESHS